MNKCKIKNIFKNNPNMINILENIMIMFTKVNFLRYSEIIIYEIFNYFMYF